MKNVPNILDALHYTENWENRFKIFKEKFKFEENTRNREIFFILSLKYKHKRTLLKLRNIVSGSINSFPYRLVEKFWKTLKSVFSIKKKAMDANKSKVKKFYIWNMFCGINIFLFEIIFEIYI